MNEKRRWVIVLTSVLRIPVRGLGLVGVACVLLAIWRVADPSLGSAAQVLPPERQGLIVFVARSGLYVIDAKGGPAKKIPGTRLNDSDPVRSPDGRRIAFVRDMGERVENLDIWIMHADGSHQRQLTYSPENDASPAWATHGRSLAFQSDRRGESEVYAIAVDTGAARRVTGPGDHPDWTSDGRIIFGVGLEGRLMTVRPYGADRQPLPTQPDGGAEIARVSNDGLSIAYRQSGFASGNLAIARIDGSNPTRLTSLRSDGIPAWSPDDQWIAFDRILSSGATAIYVLPARGGNEVLLTSLRRSCCPDWRRDR